MPLNIVGIAGSLRKDSANKKLLLAAKGLCPAEATIEVVDWSALPIFNQDDEMNFPASAKAFKETIRAADAILFVTPEYNHSIPGGMKNAIDWASRPYGDSAWQGKSVAIMSASPGMLGGIRAQIALRQCMTFLDMHEVQQPEVVLGGAFEAFNEDGTLKNEKAKELVVKQLQALIDLTKKLKA